MGIATGKAIVAAGAGAVTELCPPCKWHGGKACRLEGNAPSLRERTPSPPCDHYRGQRRRQRGLGRSRGETLAELPPPASAFRSAREAQSESCPTGWIRYGGPEG
jgi:hypothetical protein